MPGGLGRHSNTWRPSVGLTEKWTVEWAKGKAKSQNGNGSKFLLLIPQPTWLVRGEHLLFHSPRERGRQAADNSHCTKSCSYCKSVYCSQVMLKINSQQQHQQKALTDCLMCWHSYKLLDKKSNTLSLFSSPYTSNLLLRENMKGVWDCECRPAGEISGSGVHGFGRAKKVDPGFEGKWGGEPLTQPQLQLVTVVVFPLRVLPSRASLRHHGGKWSRAVYIPPQQQKPC